LDIEAEHAAFIGEFIPQKEICEPDIFIVPA